VVCRYKILIKKAQKPEKDKRYEKSGRRQQQEKGQKVKSKSMETAFGGCSFIRDFPPAVEIAWRPL